MARRVQFLDTTLRDGNKLPFIALAVKDRLEIALQLARLGVDIIDAGYPAASREERESVSLIAAQVEGPSVSALSRPLGEDIDRALEALKESKKPLLHLFLPISTTFLTEILKKNRGETLRMIEDSVNQARSAGMETQFSLSEIGQAPRELILEAARTACGAGAGIVNLADTNATLYPSQVRELVAEVAEVVRACPRPAVVGVHFHNDFGLATANTLSALEAGAGHVEGTIGGLGVKGGNTPLEEVVFALEVFRQQLKLEHGIRLDQLYKTSSLISHITGIQPHPNKPIIGKCAFVEAKGSQARNSLPQGLRDLLRAGTIGRPEDTLFADQEMNLAGFTRQLEHMGVNTGEIDVEKVYHLYESQLRRKRVVLQSEVMDMVDDARLEEKAPYRLASFSVMTGSGSLPVGLVELERSGKKLAQSAHGSGAIDALCRAVDRAVGLKPQLVLYSVDSLTEGKDARAHVTVTLSHLGRRFHGHCGSTDVVEASLRAYLDAMNRLEACRLAGQEPEFYIEGEYLWE